MAIGDQYATAQEYRVYNNIKNEEIDPVLDGDLLAVSRWLERTLGRFFNQSVSQGRQYVIGDNGGKPYLNSGRTRLFTHDIVSVSTIKIDKNDDGNYADEDALASTDFELWPLNAALEPEAHPYLAIDLRAGGNEGTWPEGAHVIVNGVFGWPAVPSTIKRASIDITGVVRVEGVRATNRVVADADIEVSPAANAIFRALPMSYKRLQHFC